MKRDVQRRRVATCARGDAARCPRAFTLERFGRLAALALVKPFIGTFHRQFFGGPCLPGEVVLRNPPPYFVSYFALLRLCRGAGPHRSAARTVCGRLWGARSRRPVENTPTKLLHVGDPLGRAAFLRAAAFW